MYNDSKDYMPDPPDGNAWNNDTGVKMNASRTKDKNKRGEWR